MATEKYIKANRKAEGYATATDRYTTLKEALDCLVIDCKVAGIKTSLEEINLTKSFD